jgi:hypothetical protein
LYRYVSGAALAGAATAVVATAAAAAAAALFAAPSGAGSGAAKTYRPFKSTTATATRAAAPAPAAAAAAPAAAIELKPLHDPNREGSLLLSSAGDVFPYKLGKATVAVVVDPFIGRVVTPEYQIGYMDHHTGCHQFFVLLQNNVKSANPIHRRLAAAAPARGRQVHVRVRHGFAARRHLGRLALRLPLGARDGHGQDAAGDRADVDAAQAGRAGTPGCQIGYMDNAGGHKLSRVLTAK